MVQPPAFILQNSQNSEEWQEAALLSQKEKQVHLLFFSGHRKHFTALRFNRVTKRAEFDRPSAFIVCHPISPSLPSSMEQFRLSLPSCTALFLQLHSEKHQLPHCFLNTADFNPASFPVVTLQDSLQQHFKDKTPGSKQLVRSREPGQAVPYLYKYYLLLQDSYKTLFKRNPFPLAPVPQARDIHAEVLFQPDDVQFAASQGLVGI